MKRELSRNFHKAIPAALALYTILGCLPVHAVAQTQVSYPTEDGWTIHGTLYLPDKNAVQPVPGVVLLPEPGWVDRSIYDTYLARKLPKSGMAAIAIDVRGTGSSLGKLELDRFSPKEREKIQFDVRGAIKFLKSQKGVDPRRIAVVAAGATSDYAILEAAEQPDVRAVALISGQLGETAKGLLKTQHVPVLTVVAKKDKTSFLPMAEAYSASANEHSDLILAVGHGTVMFSHTQGLEEQVIAWLEKNLVGLGTEVEVSFKSGDGLLLHGTLHMPEHMKDGEKIPGVVLVHGAKHDQQTYTELAPELVQRGIAALRFDWRGKGLSVAQDNGNGAADNPEANGSVYLDVKAAIQFLSSQKGVDGNRIGLVAATLGTNHALKAALGNPGIKTVVLLTSNSVPKEEAKQFLNSSDVPIFAIASLEDNNYNSGSLASATRQAYQMSKSKQSQLLMYEDAGRGSEMFKAKPELQGLVLRWLLEKLNPATAVAGGKDALTSEVK